MDQGIWVEGFCGYIGYVNALKAKFRGLRHALKLCNERNWKRIDIEIDCLNAVNLIKDNEEEENHPNRVLIDDCKALVLRMKSRIVHIPRQTNKCADVLAHMGSEQLECSYLQMKCDMEECLTCAAPKTLGWYVLGCCSLFSIFFLFPVNQKKNKKSPSNNNDRIKYIELTKCLLFPHG